MDPVDFVKSLKLGIEFPKGLIPDCCYGNSSETQIQSFTENGSLEGYVDCGSLASFTSEVNSQQTQDILYSTLLAQLAANKKFNRYGEGEKWYKSYTEVLQNIGWIQQGTVGFEQYKPSKPDFQLSEVVLTFLDPLKVDPDVQKAMKNTLESLTKSPECLSLFGSNSSSETQGNFQMLPCYVDKNNMLNSASILAYFQAKPVSDNYLFVNWKKESIKLFKSVNTFTLNEDVYARVREMIEKKLGDRVEKYIKNINI